MTKKKLKIEHGKLRMGGWTLSALLLAAPLRSDLLPGFRLEKLVSPAGFVTSIAFNSVDELYYTTFKGKVFRVDGAASTLAAVVETAADGNAALLGMVFRTRDEAVLHYVSTDLTADILEIRNLATGQVIISRRLLCNAGQPCSTEHHGGNPILAPDGTIFVGLGDFGFGTLAQQLESNGGKILRMTAGEAPQIYARGFRNPFDLAFDPSTGKLIVADNGPVGEDEISLIGQDDNGGWPLTMGGQAPVDGTVAPIFTFKETVAPTGMLLLRDGGPLPANGLLLGSFVTKALYYFPNIHARPLPPPAKILSGISGPVIDVAQSSRGEIVMGTASGIYRVVVPKPGDADGNGRVDTADFEAISREILDGDGNDKFRAHEGSYQGTWGADVNLDGLIDARDLVALAKTRGPRARGARP